MNGNNDGALDDLPNSVVPTTISGLLAEEWTIDPFSSMPSFLERVFMQEAQDSFHRGLETAYDSLLAYAEQCILSIARRRSAGLVRNQQQQHSASVVTTTNISSRWHEWKEKCLDRARKVVERMLRKITGVMRRHKLAIICLCIYNIERTCLEKSSCLLAESFYGGHRVRLAESKNAREKKTVPLDRKDKVRLASFLAISVYVKTKLDQFYRYWKENGHILSTEQKLFVMLYPWIRTCYQSASFLCKWNYLLGTSPFFDLPSLILQQWVRRLSKEDSSINDELTASNTSVSDNEKGDKKHFVQNASLATALVLLGSWLTYCRSTWEQLRRDQEKSIPIPPPPPQPPSSPAMTTKPGSCCLCGARPPDRPTACTVSGFVGCNSCMEDYLQRNSQCPVTHAPCPPTAFVRLYEPHT